MWKRGNQRQETGLTQAGSKYAWNLPPREQAGNTVDSKLSCPVFVARDLSGSSLRVFQPRAEIWSRTVALAACRTSRIIKSQKTDAVLLHIGIMTRVPQQAGESV